MVLAADVAVVGAGVFGAWIGLTLQRRGASVLLVDAHAPGHARASSGGETRLIRAGYGADGLYARLAARSLPRWRELEDAAGERLFHDTGVLWMAREGDPLCTGTLATLDELGIAHERLERAELERRYPQIHFGPIAWGILEKDAGVLMARRGVQAAVREAIRLGARLCSGMAAPPREPGRRAGGVVLAGGDRIAASTTVFALGPWLGRAFPGLLADRIFVTRQEVFYFGAPAGETAFAPPAMPAWIDFGAEVYGTPDVDGRGLKVAIDRHGPPFDPESDERVLTPATLEDARARMAARFPAMADAPLLGGEVCQYENTSNGDFLLDRHPDFDDVWLVGGGSGHGFKHGPAVGELVAECLAGDGDPDPRFRLATKGRIQQRSVY